jgi:hypothetical protein
MKFKKNLEINNNNDNNEEMDSLLPYEKTTSTSEIQYYPISFFSSKKRIVKNIFLWHLPTTILTIAIIIIVSLVMSFNAVEPYLFNEVNLSAVENFSPKSEAKSFQPNAESMVFTNRYISPVDYLQPYDPEFNDYNILLETHSHSKYSDGRLSPENLLLWAVKMGYNAIIGNKPFLNIQ